MEGDPTSFEEAMRSEHSSKWLKAMCWGPSSSEGPQKHDLTMFLEYNT
jgi:hypothetical protein